MVLSTHVLKLIYFELILEYSDLSNFCFYVVLPESDDYVVVPEPDGSRHGARVPREGPFGAQRGRR